MKPESRLQRKIQQVLKDEGGFFFKIHGGPFQAAGLPDLFGIIAGLTYAIEVKCPGKKPTVIQINTLSQLRKAGAIVMIAESVEEVMDVIRQVRTLSARSREIFADKTWRSTLLRTGYGEDLDYNGSNRVS